MVAPFSRRKPRTRGLLRGSKALAFDGNGSDDMNHWLFGDETFPRDMEAALDELMEHTVEPGGLKWVLFPPEGYRL